MFANMFVGNLSSAGNAATMFVGNWSSVGNTANMFANMFVGN